ncbi:MAG: pyridoxal-phosphate dependent enzyme, partial [Armatimonadetes bacterium]|nr:pyridoxal-phosphate dependent enzyme [Armatimonadota bacterium]
GDLRPGGTILEVTSGNTGIGLSMVGAMRGYRVVIFLPKTVSAERRAMIRAYGAELRLLERLHDIHDAVGQAIQMAREDASIFLPSQFSNADNPACPASTRRCGSSGSQFQKRRSSCTSSGRSTTACPPSGT